jgi:glyoxylase-like metal-dependent hydrolase (beta-lactamase superfamily II)
MSGGIGKGIAEAVPGVPMLRRVLAPNPSPMTGQGTWTYLLGRRQVIIVDPGPDDQGHLAAVLAAVPADARVVAVVVTHAHLDHSALAPAMAAATRAPVMAFGPATAGRSALMQSLSDGGLTAGGEGIDHAFRPDLPLRDGDVVSSDAGSLIALHTPGHLGGHLCLALDDVLLTGDHVMAWAPSLVSPPDGDMGAYMQSLRRLQGRQWRLMLPAHGAPVTDPAARLAELILHRRSREAQILSALQAGPATLATVTRTVYHGIAEALLPAATRNALAHLIDLEQRSLISADPAPSLAALWNLC